MPQGVVSVSGLSLRHNFAWTLAGNVVYTGCQWGMLMVLAKLGSPEMVGRFALGLAVCAPVIMFANMGMRGAQATDARREYLFGHYLGLRLLTVSLALLVIMGIAAWSGYQRQTALVIVALGLAKACESISDVIYGLLQQHERMDRIAISMFIKGPLSLAALGLGVYLSGNVLWGAIGLAIAWAVILFSYDMRCGSLILQAFPQTPSNPGPGRAVWSADIRPRWEIGKMLRLLWLTLPLGLAAMLISLDSNIPRYIIERYLGERELGIFAAMAYLIIAGKMVVSGLLQAAMPRLAKYYAMGDSRAFRVLLLKLVGLTALLAGAGVLVVLTAGREILTILYRPEYAQQAQVLLWLMAAAGISYLGLAWGCGIGAARYFKSLLPIYALVTGCTALAGFWLIPGHGLQGAALTMLISAAVFAGATLAMLWYIINNFPSQTVGSS